MRYMLFFFMTFLIVLSCAGKDYFHGDEDEKREELPLALNNLLKNRDVFKLDCSYDVYLSNESGFKSKVKAHTVTKAFIVFDFNDFSLYANGDFYKMNRDKSEVFPDLSNKMSYAKMMVHFMRKKRAIPFSAMKMPEAPAESGRTPLILMPDDKDQQFKYFSVDKIVETCLNDVFVEYRDDDGTITYERTKLSNLP